MSKIKEDREKILIISIGLPASGKSFFVQKLISNPTFQKRYPRVKVIDPDVIRSSLFGNIFNPANEEIVMQEKREKIKNAFQSADCIIVDDMHYYVSMRHELYSLAQNMNAFYFPIYISTPLNECIKNNHKRGVIIPDSVIEKVSKKLNVPGSKYKWDKPKFQIDSKSAKYPDIILYLLKTIQIEKNQYFRLEYESLMEKSQQKEQYQEDMNIIEKNTRILMGQLIQGKINEPLLSIIHLKLIKKKILTEQEWSQKKLIGKKLSKVRHLYKIWLLNKSKTNATAENLIQFLES
ncbi:MAG: AAA family ATPase [Promethearchaeota archaeon]